MQKKRHPARVWALVSGFYCWWRKHSPKFCIVGVGSELDNIKKLAKVLKTDNVIFYGQRPLEDMPGLYKIADAMLVTLEDKCNELLLLIFQYR